MPQIKNTSNTHFALPYGTAANGGFIEVRAGATADVTDEQLKDMQSHGTLKQMFEDGQIVTGSKARGGSDKGDHGKVAVVQAKDGKSYEVHMDGSPVEVGLTKAEADKSAASLKG
jgi:hypothetical protein